MKFSIGIAAIVVSSVASVASAFRFSPSISSKIGITTSPSNSRLAVATEDNALFVDETRASVSNYYGKELASSEDLKTNACCTAGAPPKYIQEAIQNIHPEVVAKYYGCGLCLPQYPLEGCSVLDLGSGSGRDVYIASQLVGPTGKVSASVGGCHIVKREEQNRLCQKGHRTEFRRFRDFVDSFLFAVLLLIFIVVFRLGR